MVKLLPRGWKTKFIKLSCMAVTLLVCFRIYKAIFRKKGVNNFIYKDLSGKVLQRDYNGWNIVNDKVCLMKYDFVMTHFKLPKRVPIFVYHEREGSRISKEIIRHGIYEGYNVDKIITFLKRFPNAVFLDIGANVGPFSLPIAAHGYKVIAIEHNPSNVMRLCASMNRANLVDKITIVCNSVGDHCRIGTQIIKDENEMEISDFYIENGVASFDTILLDDLLDIYKFQHVIMKLSVGGKEYDILKGSNKFFDQVNVEALLIEFYHHKNKESGKRIIDFLASHALEPVVESNIKDDPSRWDAKDISFIRKTRLDIR